MFASTASESPEKTKSESQVPLSSLNVQQPRTGRPVEDAYSSSFSEWNVDKTWSSEEWKSDESMEVRTGRPVLFAHHTDRFIVDYDNMDSYTEVSLKSTSFLHRLNDRVRKILDHSSKDAMQDIDKHSLIWGMFMFSTVEAYVFMGKNYSDNLRSIKNTGNNFTLKQIDVRHI